MHRFPRRWPVVLLALAVVCSGSAIAWSQQLQPTYLPVDPAYSAPVYSAPVGLTQTVSMSAQPANHQVYQTAMSAANAGLAARVEKLEAQAAAAKKKSAGGMSAKVGGQMFWDWTLYDQDAGSKLLPGTGGVYGDQENGSEARAVRVSMKGSGFDVFDYAIEMDFADRGQIAFKSTYLQINELPILGHVRAGFFKEPFALEELTHDRFTTFTEPNMANGAFSVSRRTGVMAFNQSENERLLWQIGVFSTNEDGTDSDHDQPPYFEDDRGGTAVTMRLCGTPWYDEATNGRGLVHTGIAYSYRDVANGSHRFSVRPEDHLGDAVLDTTFFNIDNYEMLNIQTALVYGPFSMQAEYITVATDGILANPSNTLDGGYVFMSYFLTGENRGYSRSKGAFTRVKPFENFFRVRTEDGSCQTGKGAWEIAYRFSTVDFANGFYWNGTAIVPGGGGNVNNHTFGVNWYLTPYMRVMANLIHSDAFRDNNHGSENIFITRAQIDW